MTPGKPLNALIAIADQFKPQGTVIETQAFGHGNINDTFLVTLDTSPNNHFILQSINTKVFEHPQGVMKNLQTFTHHASRRLQQMTLNDRVWKIPQVLLTQNGQDHIIDANGAFWRAMTYIDSTQSLDTIPDIPHAQEIGYALGMFHHLLSDLPTEKLIDTLVGFHITPRYLQHYQQVLAQTRVPSSPEITYGLNFIRQRQDWASILEKAKTQGILPLRPIHGDPKVNNVLLDTRTHQAVSMIDLDTVKPGLIHYDIGDCLRSGCNRLGEETQEWESVSFDPDLCQGILQGYLSMARSFLQESDYAYLYDAIRLLAFELGLRFFTDYLAGNLYFKVKHPEHNLVRALVQFKLTESIESQATMLRTLIQDLQ